MIRGIEGNWKQSIGYFLTTGPMKTEIISSKLKECIILLQKSNLIPKVTICDQGSGNRGCKSLLNVDENDQSFIIDGQRLFFLYDPPHLLKSIRNAFHKSGFIFKGHVHLKVKSCSFLIY